MRKTHMQEMPVEVEPARNPRRAIEAIGTLAMLVVISIGLMMTGCAPEADRSIHFLKSYEQVVAGGEYRVAPPDTITIECPIAPEVDGVTRQLRPDGKIALRLLGEVHVAGLSTVEIAEKLERLLQRYYQRPEVVVDVQRYSSQFFYIFGEVSRPGPRRYTGRDRLLTVISESRPNIFAWQEKIRITRPGPTEADRATLIVNLKDITERGELEHDLLLQPGDVVFVPPTPLAWVGHQVRALLYPIEPALRVYEAPSDFDEASDFYQGNDND